MLAGELEGLDGVRGLKGIEAFEAEGVGQRLRDIGTVLDDENGGPSHGGVLFACGVTWAA
jgi:hypothetical protein